MPDLLLELLSEEIPARMQRNGAAELRRRVTDALVAAGLTYEGAREYWTPRRLTLDIRGIAERAADLREEKRGPRVDAPPQAIEGFVRANSLSSIEQAQIRADPKKGDFYVAVVETPGRAAQEIIAEALPRIIAEFPWPKSMRWGEASRSTTSLRWVRPLHSILCLFGPQTEAADIIPFSVDGIAAGATTRGHRFMAPAPIRVRHFEDYAQALEKAKIVLDPDRRREIIATDARTRAFALGLELVEDAGLLNETSNLVEWPVVLLGQFDESFLGLPEEVIRLTIREHQKCFVLRQPGGSLTNRFAVVANMEAADGGAEIARGNGKVINARLADAAFFWESDLHQVRQGFDGWIEGLGKVVFHAKLGTQGERIARLERLARELAEAVGADPDQAGRAALLAKADLQSAMVFEFPELQGRMGRLYAQAAGEDEAIARAIEEHYAPLGPSDAVPRNPVSIAVALADKLDLLAGFWAIGEKPTGSRDPFALRRAALGVIRIVLENSLRLALLPHLERQIGVFLARQDSEGRDRTARQLALDLLAFLHERLRVHLRETGARHDLIDAVLTSEADDLTIVQRKLRALSTLLGTADGGDLLTLYRRAANIVAAERKKNTPVARQVDPDLFTSDAERDLFNALAKVESAAAEAAAREDFEGAIAELALLRAPIDRFFVDVLVNAEEQEVRANRLALLDRIRAATAAIADLSRIAG